MLPTHTYTRVSSPCLEIQSGLFQIGTKWKTIVELRYVLEFNTLIQNVRCLSVKGV